MVTAAAPKSPAGSPVQRFLDALEIDTRLLAMTGALAVIWIGFHLLSGGTFLTPRNLWNLAVQSADIAIMATGMVLIIVARHIDLSVGSVQGVVAMIMAWLMVEVFPIGTGWNWMVALLLGIAAAVAIGAFQGWWIAYRGVPAFVVTLGGLLVFRGLAWAVTEGRTVAPLDDSFTLIGGGLRGAIGAFWSWVVGGLMIAFILVAAVMGRSQRKRYAFALRPLWAEILVTGSAVAAVVAFVMVMNSYYRPRTDIPQGIPIPVLIVIGVALFMGFVTRSTRFGRYVFAIGGNPEAAQLAGIDVRKVTVGIFALMGLLAGIAAAMAAARLNAGANSIGTLNELTVIAAAVIGGTSLAGGVGTIAGAILGAVIMQSLQAGMILLGLPSPMQNVVIGGVLILAVWVDTIFQRSRR